jgi:Flp pilus assembly protein TadG
MDEEIVSTEEEIEEPEELSIAQVSKSGSSQSASHIPFFVCGLVVCVLFITGICYVEYSGMFAFTYSRADAQTTSARLAASNASTTSSTSTTTPTTTPLNVAQYNALLLKNANYPVVLVSTSTLYAATSTASSTVKHLWPVKTVYPNGGALLPFNRIVAYYGNFYSTKMGVLGKYPVPQMLTMLNAAVAQWQAADPSTPVIPGIDYIAVTAQGSPGADGKYRLRMPDSQIDEALGLANQEHGILILDIQVGLSNVQTEVPLLEKYLALPNVELALDPEFSMKDGAKPGSEIGTMDATDINFAANYLAGLVRANNLPPKILVVHRFTEDMVTNYQNITPLPEVQIVMDMDGWGTQAKKLNTYLRVIEDEPVQFTGFKLFYVNDLKPPSTGMLTPAQVLKLTPQPLFIQYQ